MENATKALIIAAAVLIAIVLVALGINLISSTSDTADAGEKTGNAIIDKTQQASSSLKDKLNINTTNSMDEDSFNSYIVTNYSGRRTGGEVLELCSLLKNRYGSVHKDHNVPHVTCGSYAINASNIENKVDRGKNYKVTFSGAKNKQSIQVVEQ